MRCRKSAAKEHRQRAGDSRTDSAGRNDAKRVRSRERNGAFRNEGQAHDKVGNRRLPFFRRKLISKDQHRQGDSQGGNHAAGHDRCHDARADSLTGGAHERCRPKDVSRFVDRTAKVDRHHAAEDEAEDDTARRRHAVEAVKQPGIEDSRRRIDDKGHDEADENQTENRVKQDGLGAFLYKIKLE